MHVKLEPWYIAGGNVLYRLLAVVFETGSYYVA
jgi:hypothetical protein